MEIPVLIEPVPGSGFRATGGAPFALTAEGPTREEALRNLRSLVEGRLGNGAEVVSLKVPAEHPWAEFAGTLRDEPLLDEWKQAMRDYRRQIDEDPDTRTT